MTKSLLTTAPFPIRYDMRSSTSRSEPRLRTVNDAISEVDSGIT